MSWRARTFKAHRWIGLVVGLQLLAWSAGGLFFSLFDIETVRGNADALQVEPTAIDPERAYVAPDRAMQEATDAGIDVSGVTRIVLKDDRKGVPAYHLQRGNSSVALVHAETGRIQSRVSEQEAAEIAQGDFIPGAEVLSSILIENDPPAELGGRSLPVWQVLLDHPKAPHLYIDAVTGEVVARRNRIWRIFDFFWMLHIMDYSERENFHHPLLTGMSVLALLSSLTGIALWGWRLAPRRVTRSKARSPGSG